MQPLPATEVVKEVLAFDFDGTLHDPRSGAILEPEFFEVIEWARHRQDVHWGICTGRSLLQLVEGFVECRFPFLPDFVVAREREIYLPGRFGRWLPEKQWNRRCEKDHRILFRKAKRVLRRIREYVEKETKARWIEVSGDPAGVIASSVEEMDGILEWARDEMKHVSVLSYERNEIYLRFSHRDFTKGSALRHVAEGAGVDVDGVLAVGDNANDLSMLHRDIAQRLGCPGNAIASVKERVSEHRGVVAERPGCQGVLEILEAYLKEPRRLR